MFFSLKKFLEESPDRLSVILLCGQEEDWVNYTASPEENVCKGMVPWVSVALIKGLNHPGGEKGDKEEKENDKNANNENV